MNYSMEFIGNEALSDKKLSGKPLNIVELKERFNNDFVKNTKTQAVKIFFIHPNQLLVPFIAGVRKGKVVVINMMTKTEYTPKEFSEGLNQLDELLSK